jgi:hypothetical protein
VLDDPILQAMSIFDHRKWPSSEEILGDSYTDEVELLFETYKGFFPLSTNIEAVQEQWKAIKMEINGTIGLSSRKFHELWPHMLIHYSEEFPDILRLVVIALLVPTDTSECERIFSVMNDLKTAERSSLAEKLSSLMMWHVEGRAMACSEVPVTWTFCRSSGCWPASVGGMHTGGSSRPSMITLSKWKRRRRSTEVLRRL